MQLEETLEGLARHRPGKHIAPHDDVVDLCSMQIFQDRFKGGQVPVDVIERRDPHLLNNADDSRWRRDCN
jgi:hypothetical protein